MNISFFGIWSQIESILELHLFEFIARILLIIISKIFFSGSTSQLIVHSSRVRTPKRHNSESVLYMNDDQLSVISDSSKTSPSERSSRSNYRLFPVSTYVESPSGDSQHSPTAQPLLR